MNLTCHFMGYSYVNDSIYKASLIILSIILSILTFPTVIINLAIVVVVVKRRVFHGPAYLIISNMALSDFLCGCTAYPCWAVISTNFILDGDPCSVAMVSTPMGYIFCATLFMSIVLQSAERYIAIFYPFWYREKMTIWVVLFLCVVTWAVSFSFVAVLVISRDNQIFSGIFGTSALVMSVGTIVSYGKIFKEVKRIEKQIACQGVVMSADDIKFKSESKVSKATVIILFTFLTCFAPGSVLTFCNSIAGETTYIADVLIYWFWVLALLNSFLNLLVICRQLSVFRRSLVNFLCFWKSMDQIVPHRISQFQDIDGTRKRISRVTIMPSQNKFGDRQISLGL
eukprot:Seg6591.1 transcript_id=Seg6591.1/GoldUCD/mRNA.D3Y31 product="Trace amine-associated receptor 1" protein_id=Seg6591.1/GoldUCD/D3Y31